MLAPVGVRFQSMGTQEGGNVTDAPILADFLTCAYGCVECDHFDARSSLLRHLLVLLYGGEGVLRVINS